MVTLQLVTVTKLVAVCGWVGGEGRRLMKHGRQMLNIVIALPTAAHAAVVGGCSVYEQDAAHVFFLPPQQACD